MSRAYRDVSVKVELPVEIVINDPQAGTHVNKRYQRKLLLQMDVYSNRSGLVIAGQALAKVKRAVERLLRTES